MSTTDLVPGVARYPNLFSEGRFGRLTIRNRIVMPAMGTHYGGPSDEPTDRHLRYYAARARGGVGLVISELVKVESEIDYAEPGFVLCLDSDQKIAAFSDLAQAIHDHGAAACLQLTPGFGRQASVAADHPPVSSSAVPAFMNPAVTCHGLTRDEIQGIVRAYAAAAGRAVLAGFDAIEVHGHTGYLVDQFLSTAWNKRTDEYGGSLENRLRFATEILAATRERVGPDFPISFRFSAELKTNEDRPHAEAVAIVKALVAAGATVLHVDAGCYEAMPWIFPPMYFGLGPMLDLAGSIKKEVGVPVIAVGSVLDPELAERAIKDSKCDFIASGRGLLADPFWPRKVFEGREREVRRCIMCNEYCVGRILHGLPISCVVNPECGREGWFDTSPAREKKKVVVVGGGPAGMEAASTAAERGHEVVLFESGDELGGQLLLAAAPEFKRSLLYPVEYLKRRLKDTGVKVRLRTEATPETIAHERPDAVIVATGARPLIPDLPGVDGKNVVTAWDVHRSHTSAGGPARAGGSGHADSTRAGGFAHAGLGHRVVVAGGGLVGCETALDLARSGREVTVVEMLPDVATDLNLVNRMALLSLLGQAGVKILTRHRITAFTSAGVKAADPDGKEKLVPAETIVLAFGATAVNDLARRIRDRYPYVRSVGDCVTPRKIGAAIHDGFHAGVEV